LLENLTEWKKPKVVGIGKKMDRMHIKSDYCLKKATQSFSILTGLIESIFLRNAS
jgi:adenine-specific DNA methylase